MILYYIYPILAAVKINRNLKKESQKKDSKIIKEKWDAVLAKTKHDNVIVEKISNDIYVSHASGISKIENKASVLLAGVGIPISLLAILLSSGLSKPMLPLHFFSIIIFSFAVSEMTMTSIGSAFAFRVGTRHISNLLDLKKLLDSSENNLYDWVSTQLTNVEMNNDLWIIKGNWLDVAQIHFSRGLVATSIGFVFLVASTLISQNPLHFEINLLDNIFINDSVS